MRRRARSLWTATLPAGSEGIPAMYEAERTAIPGGSGVIEYQHRRRARRPRRHPAERVRPDLPKGYVAFALPVH